MAGKCFLSFTSRSSVSSKCPCSTKMWRQVLKEGGIWISKFVYVFMRNSPLQLSIMYDDILWLFSSRAACSKFIDLLGSIKLWDSKVSFSSPSAPVTNVFSSAISFRRPSKLSFSTSWNACFLILETLVSSSLIFRYLSESWGI